MVKKKYENMGAIMQLGPCECSKYEQNDINYIRYNFLKDLKEKNYNGIINYYETNTYISHEIRRDPSRYHEISDDLKIFNK